MTKDEWIQEAKALLFDIYVLDSSTTFRKKSKELIDEAGGYDVFAGESPTTPLRWNKEDR